LKVTCPPIMESPTSHAPTPTPEIRGGCRKASQDSPGSSPAGQVGSGRCCRRLQLPSQRRWTNANHGSARGLRSERRWWPSDLFLQQISSIMHCLSCWLAANMQALIGLRTVAAAAGAQIDCDTAGASERAPHIFPHTWPPSRCRCQILCHVTPHLAPQLFAELRVRPPLSNVGRRTMRPSRSNSVVSPFNHLSVGASRARCRCLHEP
jgi:hypothetical protein